MCKMTSYSWNITCSDLKQDNLSSSTVKPGQYFFWDCQLVRSQKDKLSYVSGPGLDKRSSFLDCDLIRSQKQDKQGSRSG